MTQIDLQPTIQRIPRTGLCADRWVPITKLWPVDRSTEIWD